MTEPTFPFDLGDALVHPDCCDCCPGSDSECETCNLFDDFSNHITALHNTVVEAEHDPTPEELDKVDDMELCDECMFCETVQTTWGSMYEPPDYDPFCVACHSIIEECLCGGRFFVKREDHEQQ